MLEHAHVAAKISNIHAIVGPRKERKHSHSHSPDGGSEMPGRGNGLGNWPAGQGYEFTRPGVGVEGFLG